MSASVGKVAMLQASASAYESTTALAVAVQEQCPQPVGMLQVAALLESAGITDAIAQRHYGYLDVFTLAEAVQIDLALVTLSPMHIVTDLPSDVWQEKSSDYSRGPLTMLPIIFLSFIIMAYQYYGQWQNSQVLALGFAMLGSLLVTSGFVQAASRKGSSYLSQGYISAAFRVVFLILGVSLITVFLVAVVGGSFLLLTGWLSPNDILLTGIAYLSLSLLWLVAAVFFLLQKILWYGISLGISVVVSYAALRVGMHFNLPPDLTLLLATISGLIALLIATIVVVSFTYRQRTLASAVGKHPVKLPPTPHLIVNLAPYFIYGVLYVTMIISGHVPGWVGMVASGTRETAISTVEAGLTLALGGYILVGGVAEHSIRRFWQHIKVFQVQSSGEETIEFNQRLIDFFKHERKTYLLALLFCTVLVFLTTMLMAHLAAQQEPNPLAFTQSTMTVFVMGLIGYAAMAYGIFSCMFLISLSQPKKAITAVLFGIIITLAAGLIIGRFLPYQYCTIGMVIGSMVFARVSFNRLSEVWQYADYYYYASF